eukprot:15456571-Alexandrium_andersonii.AAC.1
MAGPLEESLVAIPPTPLLHPPGRLRVCFCLFFGDAVLHWRPGESRDTVISAPANLTEESL